MKEWTREEFLAEMRSIFDDAKAMVGSGHPVTFDYEHQRVEDAQLIFDHIMLILLANDANFESVLVKTRYEREKCPERVLEPTHEDFEDWDRK